MLRPPAPRRSPLFIMERLRRVYARREQAGIEPAQDRQQVDQRDRRRQAPGEHLLIDPRRRADHEQLDDDGRADHKPYRRDERQLTEDLKADAPRRRAIRPPETELAPPLVPVLPEH